MKEPLMGEERTKPLRKVLKKRLHTLETEISVRKKLKVIPS